MKRSTKNGILIFLTIVGMIFTIHIAKNIFSNHVSQEMKTTPTNNHPNMSELPISNQDNVEQSQSQNNAKT